MGAILIKSTAQPLSDWSDAGSMEGNLCLLPEPEQNLMAGFVIGPYVIVFPNE